MGLIREIQGLNATIDKKERARREREQKKILLQNYQDELIGNLKACYFQAFNSYIPSKAESILLENKDKNIAKICDIMEKVTHIENNKKYYTYKGLFDIVGDLEQKYYNELQKFKREYIKLQYDKQTEVEKILFDELLYYCQSNIDKIGATIRTLQKYDTMVIIVDDITSKDELKEFLYSRYITILSKVQKHFKTELQHEKEYTKNMIQLEKQKRLQKIKKDTMQIYFLKRLNKFLVSNRKKKRRR